MAPISPSDLSPRPPQPPPTSCCSCGGATAAPISSHPPWSEVSPPPAYRPIRAPAINAPVQTTSIVLSPVPQPLPVPIASPPYSFEVPTKRISSPDDLRRFHSSAAGHHFLGFVAALSHSVRGRKISDPVPSPLPPTLTSLLSLLDTLSRWADEIPPLPHSARYGNPAFRSWHDRLSSDLLLLLLPSAELRPAAAELLPYLLDSFGNPSRIDYGTGHETNFAAFLYCIARLGIVKEEDYPPLVTRVFASYLGLMRKLQTAYSLEPAGSHGVWGLDDYHFLPFVFGSAQLIDHKYIKPKSIHNEDILENFSHEYMYLAGVSLCEEGEEGAILRALPDARRHQRGAELEQGQQRDAQDVQGRGAREGSHHAAFPIWFAHQMETLLNLLLRNYLHYNLYNQAEKLRSKAPQFEAHSNQQAVRIGDLELFRTVADKFSLTFSSDRTRNLIVSLRHNVIRTVLRNISISYSQILL